MLWLSGAAVVVPAAVDNNNQDGGGGVGQRQRTTTTTASRDNNFFRGNNNSNSGSNPQEDDMIAPGDDHHVVDLEDVPLLLSSGDGNNNNISGGGADFTIAASSSQLNGDRSGGGGGGGASAMSSSSLMVTSGGQAPAPTPITVTSSASAVAGAQSPSGATSLIRSRKGDLKAGQHVKQYHKRRRKGTRGTAAGGTAGGGASAGLNGHRKPLLDPLGSSGGGGATATDSSPLGGAGGNTLLNTSSTTSANSSTGCGGGSSGGGSGSRVVRGGVLCYPFKLCCRPSSIRCMNFMARFVLWSAIFIMALAVLWYTYELYVYGMDPHLVAWFSAGAFVLLGFPFSMWGIVGHLANYNQPHTQVYIVRILWMVPIYSVESWLAMRFHKHAIYIETLRDLYESYVLYSFFQFLIQVLGGEEALVLMLKDKSPTRGVHMWGFQWCVKPWLMGQPVRKTVYQRDDESGRRRAVKRVSWKSPFFVKCKFGVLQYVLLKFVSSIAVMILELHGWYKEGDFTPRGGYLYICFLTNLSQCWALYCLVIFYYATHTELSPIRPVGKFLSVKALVFFTWWQSVALAFLLWMGLIPPYSFQQQNWTPEDVAKALQDYLICIEMFVASIVHTFVFPHTEYAPRAVEARNRALNQTPMKWHKKRLGRSKYSSHYLYGAGFWRDDSSRSGGGPSDMEMVSLNSGSLYTPDSAWDDNGGPQLSPVTDRRSRASSLDSTENYAAPPNSSITDDYPMGSWDDNDRHLDPVMDATEEEDDDDDNRVEERSIDRDDVVDDSHMKTSELNNEDDHGADDYSEELLDDYDDVDGDDEADDFVIATGPHGGGGGTGSGPPSVASSTNKPGFVRAFFDTAIPRDMVDSTVGLVKGDYIVERKTLLHHATTSDQYDLFSPARRPFRRKESDNT